MSAGSYIPFPSDVPSPTVAFRCHSVATPLATDDGFGDWGEGADFRHFQRERTQNGGAVAAVATVATPQPHRLPWSAGLAALRTLAAPGYMPDGTWDHLVYVATRLSDQWGDKAHAAGWSTLDLFGCNPQPWVARADRNGLAMLLAGWAGPIRVVDVEPASIVLEAINGSRLRYGRFDRSAAVPIWEGFAMPRGP